MGDDDSVEMNTAHWIALLCLCAIIVAHLLKARRTEAGKAPAGVQDAMLLEEEQARLARLQRFGDVGGADVAQSTVLRGRRHLVSITKRNEAHAARQRAVA